jgi:hypothetical protein
MPAYDRPEGRAGGLPIEGTRLRQGWIGKPKARRKLRIASTENPAAKVARRAERRGLLRLRLD